MDISCVQGNLQMTAYAPADFPEPDLIDNKNMPNLTTTVSNAGQYSVAPSNPIAQLSTSGS